MYFENDENLEEKDLIKLAKIYEKFSKNQRKMRKYFSALSEIEIKLIEKDLTKDFLENMLEIL